MDMDEFLKALAEIDALKERVGVLEEAIQEMRDELAELKADVGDGAIEDIAAALEEDDPYGWVGGTD